MTTNKINKVVIALARKFADTYHKQQLFISAMFGMISKHTNADLMHINNLASQNKISDTIRQRVYSFFESIDLADKPQHVTSLDGVLCDEYTPSEIRELGIFEDTTLGRVNKKSVYQIVNDKLINEIENGRLPWRKEWQATYIGNESGVFFNYRTKKPYRGINPWLLLADLKLHHCNFFATKAQIEQAGGTIKKGATKFYIVYNGKAEKTITVEPTATNPEGTLIEKIRFLKGYWIYNLADTDLTNWQKVLPEPKPQTETEIIAACEKVYEKMPNKPTLKHGGDGAYYVPTLDYVQMPKLIDFSKPQYYYSTLFHELVHSTGHKKRLNRNLSTSQTSPEYRFEELIAEVGASYLCAFSGIFFSTKQNNAAYLRGYCKQLAADAKDNATFLFRAAAQSQKASQYILSKQFKAQKRKTKQLSGANYNKELLQNKRKPGIVEHINLGKPSVLLQTFGVPDLHVKLPTSVITKSTLTKHHLLFEHFINLDDKINKPVAILKSAQPKSIVVLVELIDLKKNPVIVALQINYKLKSVMVNRVASIYGKNKKSFAKWITDSKALYIDENKKVFFAAFAAPIAATYRKKTFSGTNTNATNISKNINSLNGSDGIIDAIKQVYPKADIFEIPAKPIKNKFTKASDIVSGGTYQLDGDIGLLLGGLGNQQASITIEGDKGAGKSQLAWMIADALADKGKRVAIFTPEMLQTSPTITSYRDKYIKTSNQENVIVNDEKLTAKELGELADNYDAAIIDSFNELADYEQTQFGKLFKSHPEKVFVGLFQSHTGNQARGGIKPMSDAFINIYVHKTKDFNNNYAECTKNRFAATGPKFNIASQSITTDGSYPTTEIIK